jgi:hypothetical protein
MRCGKCRYDTPDVHLRPEFGLVLCDVCAREEFCSRNYRQGFPYVEDPKFLERFRKLFGNRYD